MKRLFDLTLALGALLLLSPLLVAAALAVRLSSPGPILFRQRRVGLGGRTFLIYKFRTMEQGRVTRGSGVTVGDDPRITQVGALLRRSKLDELPQLFNVVRGDMALVGPRPDVPEVVATYTPAQRAILTVRPGLTSVASLDLAHEEELLQLAREPERFYLEVVVPAKVARDMAHVRDRSPLFALRVLWDTAVRLSPTAGSAPDGELTRRLRRAIDRWNMEHARAHPPGSEPRTTAGATEGATAGATEGATEGMSP